jgi:hypothetical protein
MYAKRRIFVCQVATSEGERGEIPSMYSGELGRRAVHAVEYFHD